MEEETNIKLSPDSAMTGNIIRPVKKFPKWLMIIAGVIILLVGGVYYAYNNNLLFSISPYTESNLVSGIVNAVSRIESASYSVSASMSMVKREADAKPFTTKLSNAAELKKQYQNDYKRVEDISSILSALKYSKKNTYPYSLQLALASRTYYKATSTNDPATKAPYLYRTTDSGKNFEIEVVFETQNAISQLKKSYNYSESATRIEGRTVTFTKDSYTYFYLPSTPPKPFLVSLADNLAYFPSEGNVNASLSAQSDKDFKDWKINLDASGDFGDLTYKFNTDALKKDALYYFKINNIPSLFLGYIGIEKGQWIKVDPSQTAQDSGYSPYSSTSRDFAEAEKVYKENKQEIVRLLKKIIETADQEKLFIIENAVQKDKVDGQSLYKYDLQIRKESMIPFYSKIVDEFNKSNLKRNYPLIKDQALLDYLKSPEFNEVFDYYQKNTSITLWVDSKGFPIIITYKMRIVPQDTAVQLQDKQADIVFTLKLNDINKSTIIQAPVGAKDLQEMMDRNPYAQKSKDSQIKSYLSNVLTSSAIYYDDNNSYNNWCSNSSFINIKKSIDKSYGSGSKVVCSCDTESCKLAKKWCASALLKSGEYYCVDSTGMKTTSDDSLVCSKGGCSY